MRGEELEATTLAVAYTEVLEPAPVVISSLRQSMLGAAELRGGEGRLDGYDVRQATDVVVSHVESLFCGPPDV